MVTQPLSPLSGDPEKLLDTSDGSFEGELDGNLLLDTSESTGSRISSDLYKPVCVTSDRRQGDPEADIATQPAPRRVIHTISSSEDDEMEVESLSGFPQELLSTGNTDTPVILSLIHI